MTIRKAILIALLLPQLLFAGKRVIPWQPLSSGLEYLEILPHDAKSYAYIHAFRVNTQYFKLQSVLASDLGSPVATAREFAEKESATITINGGFFTPKHVPLGLRVQNGEIRHHMHTTAWWGVFYIDRLQPFIVSRNQYQHHDRIPFAIQAGPRLVIGEEIPKLKPGKAERTALGITKDKRVIIVVTDHYPISTHDLAVIMRDQLDCQYALNLDGGSSTQLFARAADFQLSVPSLAAVTDAVVISARKKD